MSDHHDPRICALWAHKCDAHPAQVPATIHGTADGELDIVRAAELWGHVKPEEQR